MDQATDLVLAPFVNGYAKALRHVLRTSVLERFNMIEHDAKSDPGRESDPQWLCFVFRNSRRWRLAVRKICQPLSTDFRLLSC